MIIVIINWTFLSWGHLICIAHISGQEMYDRRSNPVHEALDFLTDLKGINLEQHKESETIYSVTRDVFNGGTCSPDIFDNYIGSCKARVNRLLQNPNTLKY